MTTTATPRSIEDLADVYERDFPRLVALAAMILGGPAGAEDAVQDAFILCSRRWTADIQNPGAYLASTVANHCRNAIRRADAGHRAYVRAAAGRDDRVTTDLVELQDALMTLTEDQRVAVVLRFYLGWSTDEIAEHMSCPPATVRSRISRGISHLRHVLRDAGL